jgi:hypothetical protein
MRLILYKYVTFPIHKHNTIFLFHSVQMNPPIENPNEKFYPLVILILKLYICFIHYELSLYYTEDIIKSPLTKGIKEISLGLQEKSRFIY